MHEFQNIVIGLYYVVIPIVIGYIVLEVRRRFKAYDNFPPSTAVQVVRAIGLVSYFVLSCSLHHMAEGLGLSHFVIEMLHWHEMFAATVCFAYLVKNYKLLADQGQELVSAQRYVKMGVVLEKLGAGYGSWPAPNTIEWDDKAAQLHGFEAGGTFTYAQWISTVRDDEEVELAQLVAAPMIDSDAPYVHTVKTNDGRRLLALFIKVDGVPSGVIVEVPDDARAPIGGGSTLENLVALRNAARKL